MDYLQSFALSGAGMAVERTRVETAAMNLANAHTVLDPSQPAYRPLTVVAQPRFAGLVDQEGALAQAPVAVVQASNAAARMAYEPTHPLANAQGFVAYAGVDPATEMITLMGAIRAYEANVAALNMARALALRTLEIGRAA